MENATNQHASHYHHAAAPASVQPRAPMPVVNARRRPIPIMLGATLWVTALGACASPTEMQLDLVDQALVPQLPVAGSGEMQPPLDGQVVLQTARADIAEPAPQIERSQEGVSALARIRGPIVEAGAAASGSDTAHAVPNGTRSEGHWVAAAGAPRRVVLTDADAENTPSGSPWTSKARERWQSTSGQSALPQ